MIPYHTAHTTRAVHARAERAAEDPLPGLRAITWDREDTLKPTAYREHERVRRPDRARDEQRAR